ncbi:MAG: 3-deoxy-7-phosphoheptulonate synthase [Myxococcaceae bacterium]|nr:3-deoxy-7-phosphoheptulonate synthase [Myxococcaceae bacterium]
METWSPASWRAKPALQQPRYGDERQLAQVLERLGRMPPLVAVGEIERLKVELSQAARGERFVLQGGDCAERFDDCTSDSVQRKLKILLQMSLVLTYGARKPVTRIGRLAGQFAKPRSQDTEVVNGVSLPVFRGDNVNALEATAAGRAPDPLRLERGYFISASTLNYVRALVSGGFASLQAAEAWQLDFMPSTSAYQGYRDLAHRIRDAIDYLASLGGQAEVWRKVDFYTSHEGLVLPGEEALTRIDPERRTPYNLSCHFLWLGERTRALDGAHVEYFRGLRNPIGIKLGPKAQGDEVLALLDRLDPEREPGRITLITRMGHQGIAEALPRLIRSVKGAGRTVVWSCDPMHGNTVTVQGKKTRDFLQITSELEQAFAIHRAEGSVLGGVHFELTGDNVTECVGGAEGLGPLDLARSYETGCDPRLNYTQSLEMAFAMTRLL